MFFFSSRRRHTRYWRDWSSDVCSSDLGRVYLNDIIGTLTLGFQYFHGLRGVSRGYHSVAHLTLDKQCRGLIADIAQGYKVTIRAHTVGTTGTSIGTSQGRKLKIDVINEINFLQGVAQWQSHGGPGRAYMLKTRGGRKACRFFELFHQLP